MSDSQRLEVSAEDAGARLDAYLASQIEALSRSRLEKLINAGEVLVNGRQTPTKYLVQAGDEISVNLPPPRGAAPQAQDIPLDVVYEDSDLLVINKPAGLVVHPGAGTPDGTMVNALLAREGTVSVIGGEERPGIVHRLDKDTTGLIIVAKNDATHLALSTALAAREISRVYWALVLRRFAERAGAVEAPIGRHPTVRTKMAVTNAVDAREARTRWKVLENFGPVSLVECRLETGRTHQIRVHMAHIKHPVMGDELYGGGVKLALQVLHPREETLKNEARKLTRQMLHARELSFKHPRTGEQLRFHSDPPAGFLQLLEALRASKK